MEPAMVTMSFPRSLLFFGIPASMVAFFFWTIIPLLDLLGFKLFISFLIGLGGPFLILLLVSIKRFRNEGNPWAKFGERFRLQPMNGKAWIWTVGLAVFILGSREGLDFTRVWLEEHWIAAPKILVRMMDPDPNYFMEIQVRRNWLVLIGYLSYLIVTITGTELWFRGYVLPRQELSFGSRTWLIHGVLWNLFFMLWPWELIRLFPESLALPFVVQKLRNTWIGMIAQFAAGLPILYTLLLKVLG